MAELQALRRVGAAADHVLVRATDVRRHDLEDDGVRKLTSDIVGMHSGTVLENEPRVGYVLHLDVPRSAVDDGAVLISHGDPSSAEPVVAPLGEG